MLQVSDWHFPKFLRFNNISPTFIAFDQPSASLSNLCTEDGIFSSRNNSQSRTLRDFDETLRSLRKENFNLKLRIFFLEERSAQAQNGTASTSGSLSKLHGEEISKQNIDLKVSVTYSIRCSNKVEPLLDFAK